MIKNFHLTLILMVICGYTATSATITSVNDGAWFVGSTWGGGVVPGLGDNVTIANAVTFAVTDGTTSTAQASCKTLTINSGASLTANNGYTLTYSFLKVYGNIVNNGTLNLYTSSTKKIIIQLQAASIWSGTGTWNLERINYGKDGLSLDFANAMDITMTGSIVFQGGVTTGALNAINKRTDVTFIFKLTSTIPALDTFFYPNLTLNTGGTGTLSLTTNANSPTILGTLTLTAAGEKLSLSNNTLNFQDNATMAGAGFISAASGGGVAVTGTGAQCALRMTSGVTGYKSLTVSRTGGASIFLNTANGNFTVLNTLSITDCALELTQPYAFNCGVSGTGANVTINNTTGNASTGFTYTSVQTPTIFYYGDASNTSQLSGNIYNVTNSKTAGNVEMTGDVNVNNNLTNNFSIGGHTLSLNGTLTTAVLTGSSNSNLSLLGTQSISGLSFSQSNSSNYTLRNLTLSKTLGTSVSLGTNLQVNNAVTLAAGNTLNSSGYLTLLATATSNANLATLPSGASITGNVNVQSYFTGGVGKRSSRMVSSPINDAQSTTNTYTQLKNYMVITGSATGSDFDIGGSNSPYSTTLNTYNEPAAIASAQFIPVATLSESITPGKGFFLFYRGNRTNATTTKVNAPLDVPEDVTMQYTGVVNQGDISAPLTYTANGDAYDGYNLVGNPYPATINWDLVDKTNVAAQLTFIKPGGGYAYYTNINGTTPVSTSPYTDLRIIQPGQGFFVKAIGALPTLTFHESSKAINSSPMRLLYTPGKNMQVSSVKSITSSSDVKLIRFQLEDGINTEQNVVAFTANGSNLYDQTDVMQFGGTSISLSTLSSDNKNLAINVEPEIELVNKIKINVNAVATSEVKLNFTDLSSVSGTTISLQDNYLNQVIDLSATPIYNFTIDKAIAATFGSERFSLLFTPAAVLTVKLAKFSAVKSTGSVKVSWQTAVEMNKSVFDLERSATGNNFEKIYQTSGNLALNGLTYIDQAPLTLGYYRLKQTDENGKIDYSNVVAVDYNLSSNAVISVYPNPAAAVITVNVANFKSGMLVSICDIQGKAVKKFKLSSGLQNENIAALHAGVYVVKVFDSTTNKVIEQVKLIKN